MAKKTTEVNAAPAQTSMVRWEEEMAKLATMATETEKNVGGGNFIGLKSGQISYKGAAVPGNSIDVVIIDHILENAYYDGPYDPDNPQPPACFAFGRVEDALAPHENSSAPQHTTCKGCPMNEFGTASLGKGKACKNIRRIALISEGDLEEIEGAELAYLKTPVTSVKGWAGYVRHIADVIKRPPLGVVTTLYTVPDPKSQFKVMFRLKGTVDDPEMIGQLVEKNRVAQKEIAFPYAAATERPEPQQVRGRAVRGAAGAAVAGKRKF